MHELTHTQVRAAKPGPKIRRLSDGAGLVLTVKPSGSKLWNLRYRLNGSARMASLGAYPDVTLAMARDRAQEMRSLLADGQDPVAVTQERKKIDEERQAEADAAEALRAADTFAVMAEAYVQLNEARWVEGHTYRIRNRIEQDILPALGDMPVSQIDAPTCLAVVQAVENRGAIETSKRIKSIISAVMSYATALGKAQGDPTVHLKSVLKPNPPAKHRAALTDPVKLKEFLDDLTDWAGDGFAKPLLQLTLLTFQRPSEVRFMRWSEIDWDRKLWSFHVSKVQMDHVVPLSDQAIAILHGLEEFTEGREFVFQSQGNKPISDQLTPKLLRKLGWDKRVTAHGFRATARTMLAERLRFDPRVIELQLSHRVPETHGNAYNRALYIEDRIEMMQVWADFLDQLLSGGEVIQMRRSTTK